MVYFDATPREGRECRSLLPPEMEGNYRSGGGGGRRASLTTLDMSYLRLGRLLTSREGERERHRIAKKLYGTTKKKGAGKNCSRDEPQKILGKTLTKGPHHGVPGIHVLRHPMV